MVKGVMELRDECAGDHMTPIDKCAMLDVTDKLDMKCMSSILAHGHSRVPIYKGDPSNVKGVLLIKRLITLDPQDERPISTLEGVWRPPVFVSPDENLQMLLKRFRHTRSHLAIVCHDHTGCEKRHGDKVAYYSTYLARSLWDIPTTPMTVTHQKNT